jgi:dTDP-4-dehydrorhamnose 3,5-epimerase
MPYTAMRFPGAWVHNPTRHSDDRGHFEEQFKLSEVQPLLGHPFEVRQVNKSQSSRGVLRGIHFTESITGQAKYVSCPKGSILDFVVDLDLSSPTYGQWDSVLLSAENGKSVLISEKLGHAFLSLESDTTVQYLCSSEYDPSTDSSYSIFSENLAIDLHQIAKDYGIDHLVLSDRDKHAKNAPSKD